MQILPVIPADVGIAPQDYVSIRDGSAGAKHVRVRIGPDGNMMPTADWQDSHPSQCAKQARETGEASSVLDFKMQVNEEEHDGLARYQYFTFARIIDADSNIITQQMEGDATVGQQSTGKGGLMDNPDAEGLDQSVVEAFRKLGADLGTPSDGCGDIRLAHQAGVMVDDEFVFVAGYQNQSLPAMEYEWDFGDGSSAMSGGQLGRHVYAEKGGYTVTVHVSGEGIRPGSASIGVTVKEEEPIQPRDGLWSIEMTDIQMEGCSPKISGGIETALSEMMGKENTENLEFEEPFHPTPLMKHAKPLNWTQTGLNAWETVVADVNTKAMKQKVLLQAEVISPTLIKEVGKHDIIMSDQMAKLIGGSPHCRATGYYELTWQR